MSLIALRRLDLTVQLLKICHDPSSPSSAIRRLLETRAESAAALLRGALPVVKLIEKCRENKVDWKKNGLT